MSCEPNRCSLTHDAQRPSEGRVLVLSLRASAVEPAHFRLLLPFFFLGRRRPATAGATQHIELLFPHVPPEASAAMWSMWDRCMRLLAGDPDRAVTVHTRDEAAALPRYLGGTCSHGCQQVLLSEPVAPRAVIHLPAVGLPSVQAVAPSANVPTPAEVDAAVRWAHTQL